MDHRFIPDSIAEALAKAIAASLPFITMGFIQNKAWNCFPTLLIAAGSFGTIALFAFIIRIFMLAKKPAHKIVTLDRIMNGLTFPYIFAVCFGIGIFAGEKSGWYGVWFSLFLACWIIIAECMQSKREG